MSDSVISGILILVIVFLIAAIVLRYNAVQLFEQKKRARHWASYVVEAIRKQPHLSQRHGFFIDPKLSQLAIDELKWQCPQAVIEDKTANIHLTHKDTTWIIPICTTEEYTDLYI
ncbi:hypothetical protein D3C84_960230 [compost metagenome]